MNCPCFVQNPLSKQGQDQLNVTPSTSFEMFQLANAGCHRRTSSGQERTRRQEKRKNHPASPACRVDEVRTGAMVPIPAVESYPRC